MQTVSNPSPMSLRAAQGHSGTGSRKPIKRSYKPLPTTRYLVAGLTAIIVSMGLIAGAMSSTNYFDTRPWDPSQEMHWDPFQHHNVIGIDVGSLTESGHRKKDAVPGKKSSTQPSPGTATETTDGPQNMVPETQEPTENTPMDNTVEVPTTVETFEVPGAPQEPIGSQPPDQGNPPVAMGNWNSSPVVDVVDGVAVPKV